MAKTSNSRTLTALARWRTPAMLIALTVVLAFVSSGMGSTWSRAGIVAMIQLCFVVGLYTFSGLSGVLSLGHMGFASVGGYATGILAVPPAVAAMSTPQMPAWLRDISVTPLVAVLLGGVVAMVVAFLVGLVFMRLTSMAITLASFALLIVIYSVAVNWTSITNATRGITRIPTATTLPVALIAACVCIIVAYGVGASRWGMRLIAVREESVAAASAGADAYRLRLIAWTLSGLVAGIGGGLYAEFLGTVTANVFYIDLTFMVVAMLVVGGGLSVSGAVIGTLALSFLSQVLLNLQDGFTIFSVEVAPRPGLQPAGLAIVMLVSLLLRPRGLIGTAEIGDLRLRRKPAAADAPETSEVRAGDQPPISR